MRLSEHVFVDRHLTGFAGRFFWAGGASRPYSFALVGAVGVAPGLLLAFAQVGPSDDAALFLALRHVDGPALFDAGFFQGAVHGRQAGGF